MPKARHPDSYYSSRIAVLLMNYAVSKLERQTAHTRAAIIKLTPRRGKGRSASMTFETIQLNIADGIATLTLNRPRALNAINKQMLVELGEAFDQIAQDEQIRVVVLTGARRAFCFG